MRSAIRSSNRQASPTRRTSASRAHWAGGGEDRRFDPEHPFAPAGGCGVVGELDVEAFVAVSPAAARRGAHRPYSRNVGRPESSRTAPSATSRSNSRRAARSVIGAWRAASAGRDAILGEQQVDDFGRRFGAQFGRDGEQGVRAAGKMSGEIEGGGGGERDRAGGGVRPGGVARPWPPSAVGDRRAGSRIFVAISGSGRGQRSRMAMMRSNSQRARISASAAGASGKVENAEAAALAAAETGSPSPAQCLQAGCEAVRVRQSEVEPRPPRRGSGPGRGWAAGRRDRATARAASPQARASSPTAKRRSRSAPSSALRRRILAEAAAL